MNDSPLSLLQAQLGRLGSAGGVTPRFATYHPGANDNFSDLPGFNPTPLPVYWQPVETPSLTPSPPAAPEPPPTGADPLSGGGTGVGGAATGPGVGAVGTPGANGPDAGTTTTPGSPNTGVSNAVAGLTGAVVGVPALGLVNALVNNLAGFGNPNNTPDVVDAQGKSVPVNAFSNSPGDDAAPGEGGGNPGVASSSEGANAVGAAGGNTAEGGPGTPGPAGGGPSGGVGGGGSGCFLTSAVTRATKRGDDAVELELMRAFRDHYLMQDPKLRDLVLHYYHLAPKVVQALDRRPDAEELYKRLHEEFITPGVRHVLNGDPGSALKTYADMLSFVSPLAQNRAGTKLGAGADAVSDELAARGY